MDVSIPHVWPGEGVQPFFDVFEAGVFIHFSNVCLETQAMGEHYEQR